MGRAKWWELLIVFIVTLFATAILTYIAEAIFFVVLYWMIKNKGEDKEKGGRFY